MVMSLPSRTEAIMPHPQEQKLHEVVNSWTLESFRFLAAARTVDISSRPLSARPALPPSVMFNHSLRVIWVGLSGQELVMSLGRFSFPDLFCGPILFSALEEEVCTQSLPTPHDRNRSED